MRQTSIAIIIALALIGTPVMANVSPPESCDEKGCCNHAMERLHVDPLAMPHAVCHCAMTPLATCHWEPDHQEQQLAVVFSNNPGNSPERLPLAAKITAVQAGATAGAFQSKGPDTGPIPKPPPVYLLTCTLII